MKKYSLYNNIATSVTRPLPSSTVYTVLYFGTTGKKYHQIPQTI